MVTGDADREGVESRKYESVMAEGFRSLAGNNSLCVLASAGSHPGILGRVEPHMESAR